jgi:class 3 adenylate cyclase
VNVASRLESATKEAGCQVLISADVAKLGGLDLSAFERKRLTVRGREGGLTVHVIPRATELPQLGDTGALPGGGVSGGVARAM